jgi:hypothetical protein
MDRKGNNIRNSIIGHDGVADRKQLRTFGSNESVKGVPIEGFAIGEFNKTQSVYKFLSNVKL